MSVRWGIIGCGDVATKKTGPSFQQVPAAKLVAVADKDQKRAKDFAQQFGVRKVYDSMEELLADSEVDAVYIATPPHLHHACTIAAAQARKHVLCEKPMAHTVKQCREMIDVCTRRGVNLMVAYYRRFWPQTQMMRNLIESGEIGDVVNARTQMTGNVVFEPETVRRWKLDPKISGGGFLMDVGCHRIDLLLHLIGDVLDVTAFTDNTWEHEVDNCSNVLMRFKSGAQAIAAFNWSVNYFSDDFEIIGTEARIVASPLAGDKIYVKRQKAVQEIPTPRVEYTHASLIARCVQSIENNTPHPVAGEVGIQVNQVIEAAYRSSKERQTIRLDS